MKTKKCVCVENEKLKVYFVQLVNQSQANPTSRMKFTYKKVVRALECYPLPVTSGEMSLRLNGVGPKISTMISNFLTKNENEEEEEKVRVT